MATYAILTRRSGQDLDSQVSAAFPGSLYIWSPTMLFVQSSGTAKDVADKIGVKGSDANGNQTGTLSQVVVLEVKPSYWGFTDQSLWSWLKNAFEAPRA